MPIFSRDTYHICPHSKTDVDPEFDSAAENVLEDQESATTSVKPTGQYPGQRGPGKATLSFQNGAGVCPANFINRALNRTSKCNRKDRKILII